jgi:hypothetical protein
MAQQLTTSLNPPNPFCPSVSAVLGDLVLMGAMQFAQPALSSVFNADLQAAALQRQRIFKLAADENFWVAGSHLSFPGIGRVRAVQEGYQWVPTNYRIPK